MAKESKVTDEEELGYLVLPKDHNLHLPMNEDFKAKFIRKTKENPFVPLGLAVTTGALSYGLWQMRTGNKAMSQKMMRLRVAAQGFTVLALLGGVLFNSHQLKQAKLEQAPATKP